MTTFTAQATDAVDQYLTAVSKIQDASIEAVSTAVANAPAAAKNVPAALPTNDLPTPQEVADVYFSFTDKVLANQKAYTERFFAAVTSAS